MTKRATTANLGLVSGRPVSTVHYHSQAEAQGAVDAWLAGKDDAARYAVVYVN